MKTVTINQVMARKPCVPYTHDIITGLFAGREQLSALDILELDIPAVDRLWAVLREELIPADTLHEFACRCAENALVRERKAGREPASCSWRAIEAKREWLQDKTTAELAAAWVEAVTEISAPPWTAARATAWAAAEAADRTAPWATAWAAAEAADRSAARAAFGAASWTAEAAVRAVSGAEAKIVAGTVARAEQIDRLKEMLRREINEGFNSKKIRGSV